jgi:predicted nucleic acid-binding protein
MTELLQAGTPVAVRTWITRPPEWIEILPDPPSDPTLVTLDTGECAAIALALSLHADVLLSTIGTGAPKPCAGICV